MAEKSSVVLELDMTAFLRDVEIARREGKKLTDSEYLMRIRVDTKSATDDAKKLKKDVEKSLDNVAAQVSLDGKSAVADAAKVGDKISDAASVEATLETDSAVAAADGISEALGGVEDNANIEVDLDAGDAVSAVEGIGDALGDVADNANIEVTADTTGAVEAAEDFISAMDRAAAAGFRWADSTEQALEDVKENANIEVELDVDDAIQGIEDLDASMDRSSDTAIKWSDAVRQSVASFRDDLSGADIPDTEQFGSFKGFFDGLGGDKASAAGDAISGVTDKISGLGDVAGAVSTGNIPSLIGSLESILPAAGAVVAPLAAAAGAIGAIWVVGEQGAAANNTVQLFDRLGLSVEDLQDATGNTVPKVELMQAAVSGLAGATGSWRDSLIQSTPELLWMADSLSMINPELGSATDLYKQFTTAIKTGRTAVFERLNLDIDATKAQEEYARSLGITADNLTESQKRQALLNAVLREGVPAVEAMTKGINDHADGYDKLKTVAGDAFSSISQGIDNDLQLAFAALDWYQEKWQSFVDGMDVRFEQEVIDTGTYDVYIEKVLEAKVAQGQLSEAEAKSMLSSLKNADAKSELSDEMQGLLDVYSILTPAQYESIATQDEVSAATKDAAAAAQANADGMRDLAEAAEAVTQARVAMGKEAFPELVNESDLEVLKQVETTVGNIARIRPDLIGETEFETIMAAREELERLQAVAENLKTIRVSVQSDISTTISDYLAQPNITVLPTISFAEPEGDLATDIAGKMDEYVASILLERTTTVEQNIAVRAALQLITPEQAELELMIAQFTSIIDSALGSGAIVDVGGVPVDLSSVLLQEGEGVVADLYAQYQALIDKATAENGFVAKAQGVTTIVQSIVESGGIDPTQYDNVVKGALTAVGEGKTVEQAVAVALHPEFANIADVQSQLREAVGTGNIEKTVALQMKVDEYNATMTSLTNIATALGAVPPETTVEVAIDTENLNTSLEDIAKDLGGLDTKTATPTVETDDTDATTNIEAVNVSLDDLSVRVTTTNVEADDTAATTTIADLNALLDTLGARVTTTTVKADATNATTEINKIIAMVIPNKTVIIDADTSRYNSKAGSLTGGTAAGANQRALGGVDIVSRSTLYEAGEGAGSEIAAFIPLGNRALGKARAEQTMQVLQQYHLISPPQQSAAPVIVQVTPPAQGASQSNISQKTNLYVQDTMTASQVVNQWARQFNRATKR